MRRTRLRAAVPALALVVALAAAARADCLGRLSLEELGDAVLLASYEERQEFLMPVPMPGHWIFLEATYVSEYGVYRMPDGGVVEVECSSSIELG